MATSAKVYYSPVFLPYIHVLRCIMYRDPWVLPKSAIIKQPVLLSPEPMVLYGAQAFEGSEYLPVVRTGPPRSKGGNVRVNVYVNLKSMTWMI